MSLRNVPRVRANLRAHAREIEAILAGGLHEEGEGMMGEAKRQTPVDTGALRSTGHVQGPERKPLGRIIVTLSFGGPASAQHGGEYVGYAIYVHEDLTAHHAVGNAKFLERPVRAATPGLPRRLAMRVRLAGY